MTSKLYFLVIAPALLSSLSIHAQSSEKHDIDKVVSIKVDPFACGITDAVMTYKTSTGDVRTLEYRVWGDGCSGG
ncbi:DUF2790 domain-containing protein [Pseudomonas carnis]|uniref:DUF2790 domain-containing protein n=1 Tax=Pseudomonas carnis TaxID=2487355 RepID=UPI0018E64467|nr:DUF2790 domain-containing protein [Pseudomonas carnis]MBI6655493.1 DUF2790 domain-containing protein [Pseudomonas carnis]MBI6661598.1 DUF2790 domain-containing protein [Pseudomonas carnis]MBI6687343.1 DUF2790 domain-containing protein [Pseudomonas carnis]